MHPDLVFILTVFGSITALGLFLLAFGDSLKQKW